MSLRKSPTLTPALLESNRRNAKKFTGPRTARGKAWTRLNHLRHGRRSAQYIRLVKALSNAPPGRMGAAAQALLASQPALHPKFKEIAGLFVQVEIDICNESLFSRIREK